MKAMLLAAGRGTRLRPLTDKTPKPLIKVRDHALIEHQILRLRQAGITNIIINVSYKADKIMNALGRGSDYGVNIIYSYEGEQPLETGGGIQFALPMLGDQPFIVVSADIYTDFDYAKLQLREGKKAHLVMVDNPSYHKHGDFAIGADDIIATDGEKLTYSNIGVYHPELFRIIEPGYRKLSEILHRAIISGQVTGEHYAGMWHNIGNAADLKSLNESLP